MGAGAAGRGSGALKAAKPAGSSRIMRRRTVARRMLWLLLCAATVAFAVWALTAQPWVEPPSETTPPVSDW